MHRRTFGPLVAILLVRSEAPAVRGGSLELLVLTRHVERAQQALGVAPGEHAAGGDALHVQLEQRAALHPRDDRGRYTQGGVSTGSLQFIGFH